ncbi:MAG: iron ABC transporter permease [Clostridia bacterium]|nr:iron ABC transporter permease [Clostridia bacterium]
MNTVGGRKRRTSVLLLSAALLFVLFFVSLTFGRYSVPLSGVAKILWHRLWTLTGLDRVLPMTVSWTEAMEKTVISIRLPRILTACLVGCSLSAAGAVFQGVFRNPMASPDILGASSGAAFGAALAILLGVSTQFITIFAFISSILTVALVFLIAQRAPGQRTVNLILAGIMVGSLFSAGTSYLKLVADPGNQLPAITYWLMGSLSGVRLSSILPVAIPMAAGIVPLLLLRWRLNLLSLGESEARALGVNTDLLRAVLILCATLITAASISVSGVIGWVGLVIPHLCRKLIGSDNRGLLPCSMLVGASFLLLVDDVSRNLLATEIPIGILTAVIGAPFFIWLLLRKEKTL